jgi:hypothetical protein
MTCGSLSAYPVIPVSDASVPLEMADPPRP